MSSFNPFINRDKRPMVLNGNGQIRSESVLAIEALTEANLGKLYPDAEDDVLISEIEIWENMPIRCSVHVDFMSEWITWTGTRWIREEDAA